jgi:hypothetical protein
MVGGLKGAAVKGVGGGDGVPRHGSRHLGHRHRVQVGLLLAAAQHFPEHVHSKIHAVTLLRIIFGIINTVLYTTATRVVL